MVLTLGHSSEVFTGDSAPFKSLILLLSRLPLKIGYTLKRWLGKKIEKNKTRIHVISFAICLLSIR